MEVFAEIWQQITAFFANPWVQFASLIVVATVHGYVGAWLAVRMLFRPRRAFKVLGITLFPQGMIPRHRERLANAIGKAVGEELVSQETIMDELLGKEFLQKKIRKIVDSYAADIVSTDHPTLIEAMPKSFRPTLMDAVESLKEKIADHIEATLRDESSLETIRSFVTRRVDEFLSRRVTDVVDDDTFKQVVGFLDDRIEAAVNSTTLEEKVREFIGKRVDDIANTPTPLSSMFTSDAVDLLKEKAVEQIDPVVHRLTEVAAAQRTRDQIGALIKNEVHDFYDGLPFFKKIFVSRDNLLREVDDLVNESLPKRIEETLKGDFFSEEARSFIRTTIDDTLAKPLPELVGNIAPDQLERLKDQITRSILSVLRGAEMRSSITGYAAATLEKLRPHSIDAIMQTLQPDSEEKLKSMLSKGLLNLIGSEETRRTILDVLNSQIDRLLATPIGRLSDAISPERLDAAGDALSNAIINALHDKLPEAIKEFDVAGVVRQKINTYPVEKLESLVMSVAKEHLRTIELFGAFFGFVIGIVQALLSYWAFAK